MKASARPLSWLLLGGLLGAGLASVAASGNGRADAGDFVTYDLTIRRTGDREVLFTTDKELASHEVAQGNPWLPPPTEAEEAYRPRTGFLELSNGSGFDHVPFLLGRRVGDVVMTPALQLPISPRLLVTLPRIVEDVATTFVLPHDNLTRILDQEGGTRESFLYLGEIPARADTLNATHARISLRVSNGETYPRALGFPVRVLHASQEKADLELLLAVDETFRVTQCTANIGLDPGRYRVVAANATELTLAHLDAGDAMAASPVELEMRILDLDDRPGLLRAKTHLANVAKIDRIVRP